MTAPLIVAHAALARALRKDTAVATALALASHWSVAPEDTAALEAAARDRGFDSLDGALAAARTFHLSATHRQPGPENAPADA